MNKHLKRVLVGSVLIGVAVAGGLGIFYEYYYIPHFEVVHDGVLYRSGQPDKRDLKRLRDVYGVRTIVNLRRLNEQDGSKGLSFEQERAEADGLGLRYIHMPMNSKVDVDPNIIEQWLRVAQDEKNRPILVHCKRGVDRTGLLAAVYRIRIQGWPPEKALNEAIDLRMKPENKPHLKEYILASGKGK